MTFKKTVKTGLAFSGVLAVAAASGCSSVEKTPIEQILAVQAVVPTSKPGEMIEGLPSADQAAMTQSLANPQIAGAAQQAVASATTEAAQIQGPTVQLASAAELAATPMSPARMVATPANGTQVASLQPLAYATPMLPNAADATAAQMAATGSDENDSASAITEDDPMSITVATQPGTHGDISALIAKYATIYGVPERLIHHVANRESTYNPRALHHGNYGLMQIRYNTARSLGYEGTPLGLLDAETNLKYAVKYLRGAWLVAGKDEKAADWLYRTGYYYDAKRKGMLDQVQ